MSGLALHGEWLSYVLDNKKSHADWVSFVSDSFQANIMTPFTSFIALENESQRKALLQKQQQVLHAAKAFDVEEEIRMSEPSLFVVIALLGLVVLARKKQLFRFCYSFSRKG